MKQFLFYIFILTSIALQGQTTKDTLYIARNKSKTIYEHGIHWADLGFRQNADSVIIIEQGNLNRIDSTISKNIDSVLVKLRGFYIISISNKNYKIEEGYWGSEMLDGGVYKRYYKNGVVKCIGQYNNGQMQGLWTYYKRNGKKKRAKNW